MDRKHPAPPETTAAATAAAAQVDIKSSATVTSQTQKQIRLKVQYLTTNSTASGSLTLPDHVRAYWLELHQLLSAESLLYDMLELDEMTWQQVVVLNDKDGGLFYINIRPQYASSGQISIRIGPKPPFAVTLRATPLSSSTTVQSPIVQHSKCPEWSNKITAAVLQHIQSLFV